nr:MAG TPA: hypothetical protein [Caudoviricetes sp.]
MAKILNPSDWTKSLQTLSMKACSDFLTSFEFHTQ